MPRGYFEIGVYQPKFSVNVGTLWRTAYQLGAAGIFTIGERYARQPSDTPVSPRHIPLRNYVTFAEFRNLVPLGALLIAIEMGGEPLREYAHPNRAVYLLGSEDGGLPATILSQCDATVELSSIRTASYNVSVAGSIVAYDRVFTKAKQ